MRALPLGVPARPLTLRFMARDGSVHTCDITAQNRLDDSSIRGIVLNGRDAMSTGSTLTLETSNVTLDTYEARSLGEVGAGEYVVLSVADTGIGMSDAVKARVFEPFFTTKEPGKGTGLGLATSYGIAKQAGGMLTVQSAPGAGSTFRIYLPRVD